MHDGRHKSNKMNNCSTSVGPVNLKTYHKCEFLWAYCATLYYFLISKNVMKSNILIKTRQNI